MRPRRIAMLGWWLTVLLLLSAPKRAVGLEPPERMSDLVLTSWPGVAHVNIVDAVMVSKEGYVWVGTPEGAVRYDGSTMMLWDGVRFPGIVEREVGALFESHDRAVWVGGASGEVSALRGLHVETFGPAQGIPRGRVTGFAESAAGVLWIATDAGVARLAPAGRQAIASNEGLPATDVRVLAVDSDDVVWAGTTSGLARWNGARWIADPTLPRPITTIAAMAGGDLWVGTADQGIWRRHGRSWTQYSHQPGLATDRISASLVDHSGRLWVATVGGGIGYFAGESMHAMPLPGSACAARTRALAEDFEGGLWLGTSTCGARRITNGVARVLKISEGEESPFVRGLAPLAPDLALVALDGGALFMVRDHRSERLDCPVGISCWQCWNVSPGTARDALVSCEDGHTLHVDQRGIVTQASPPGDRLAGDQTIRAGDGAVWTVARDIVRRLGPDGRDQALDLRVLHGHRVIHAGRSGKIWIATDDGVASWQEGKLQVTLFPAETKPIPVSNLFEDDHGALWIGTMGGGLRRARAGTIATIGMREGLPTGWIVQILGDARGRLWMSGSTGVFWFTENDLNLVADGKRTHAFASFYDAADGFLLSPATFGRPAGFLAADGKLWFATKGGIAIVDPTLPQHPAPRVIFDEIRVGARTLTNPLTTPAGILGHAPQDLHVRLSALAFSSPETIAFRYRLRGLDDGWVDADPGRSIQIAHLWAGSYGLEVEARSRDGVWSEMPAHFAFRLTPPFYAAPWFILVCASALLLAFASVHAFRIGRTRSAFRAIISERARIARELHDTLAQFSVATSAQLECLEHAMGNNPTKAHWHLSRAKRVVAESIAEARRSVMLLRPVALEEGIVAALKRMVELLEGQPIATVEVQGAPRALSPTVANALLRIAQQAVANACQHAGATHIKILLAFTSRKVLLTVADDGQGIAGAEPSTSGTGQGLTGMRARAVEIGASFDLRSAVGMGSTIVVEVSA